MEPEPKFTNGASASLRLESIISSAMDAIISINPAMEVILFNPAAERMFRIPASEAMGQRIERFIPERFRAAHAAQVHAFGATGATHRRMGRLGSVRGLRSDGEEFPAEASISHVETDAGTIYTVIMRDISERVAAEMELRHSRENLERLIEQRTARLKDTIAELEQISYSLTHDMHAPLRAIRSFADLLLDEAGGSLSPEHLHFLETIKTATGRMDALLRDILNYSSVVRQNLPGADIAPERLLRSIISTYPLFQAPVEIRILGPLHPVHGNETLLAQCLSNLLNNAVKFAKPGEHPRIEVFSQMRGDVVRISVRDYGIGIPPAFQEKIFGIFQKLSNSPEGTGIGLAIVRKAAERMSGSISVESEPDKGSTFHLDLPAAKEKLSAG